MPTEHHIPTHALSQRARDFGGYTYRISDGTFPTSGFAVAVAKGPELQLDHCPTPDDIAAFAAQHADIIRAGNIVFKGGVCLGAWDAAGTWYLDISVVCRTLDEALVLGRQNHQMAVYDLEAGNPIAIPWHGVDDHRHQVA